MALHPKLIYLTRRTAQSQFWHVDLLYGGPYGGVTGGLDKPCTDLNFIVHHVPGRTGNIGMNCELRRSVATASKCGNCAEWSGSFDAAHLERAKNEESANKKGLNSMGINQRGCNEVERSTGTDRDRRQAVLYLCVWVKPIFKRD
ncbi:hypothetical protein B0H11DRAFT_1909931 [Mycena galericulata]|nr:hypothetical protein B0H11DRAFT_1909931 [Mycena galericulata]